VASRCLLIGAALAAFGSALAAQQPPDSVAQGGDSVPANPCARDEMPESSWLDWLRRHVHGGVCSSALWFDGLFGNERIDNEQTGTTGRFAPRLWWDERGGLRPRTTFRVRASLPNLEHRANLFLKVESRNAVATSPTDDDGTAQDAFDPEERHALVGGAGATLLRTRRSHLGLDLGAQLKIPVNPYARLRWRYDIVETEVFLLRFTNVAFAELERGIGNTVQVTSDWSPGASFLLRWNNLATAATEAYDGMRLETALQLYQYLGALSAISYEVSAVGETARDVPLRYYGVLVTYRKSWLRDWFLYEFRAGVSWPREALDETRRANPGLGVGVELQF